MFSPITKGIPSDFRGTSIEWRGFLRVKTVLDTDHEFDAGSKISLAGLSPLQIQNLEMLGKVWGFVKYHHPDIATGKSHWDYELFESCPRCSPPKVAMQQTRRF